MLRILLADAELELCPPELAGHPQLRASSQAQSRKATEILLDQNVHMSAVNKLPDGKRRGRPDIVHYTLLTLLESPLAKAGGLEIAIQTRHNLLLRVRNDTRLPRGEARFQGLMAKVLRDGASHDKEPLIWVEGDGSIAESVRRFAKGPIVRLDETGGQATPATLAAHADADGDLTLVLGAFPSGSFRPDWLLAAPESASIWPEPLNAWAVAAEVVAGFRALHGPQRPPGEAPRQPL